MTAPPRTTRRGAIMARASIRDVAREAGVSTALASFALNDRDGVSPATKEPILAVAARLGYRADPLARALRTGSTNTYGLIIRNMHNPYFLEVLRGAQEDRKSTRLNSSHVAISYAGFCLKKKIRSR